MGIQQKSKGKIMKSKLFGLHVFFELHNVFNDKDIREIKDIYPLEILSNYILAGRLIAKDVAWDTLNDFLYICYKNKTIPVCFFDTMFNKVRYDDWKELCTHVGLDRMAKLPFISQNSSVNSIKELRSAMKKLKINDAIYVCSELTPTEELYMKRYCVGFHIYIYETKNALINLEDFEKWMKNL